MINLIAFIVFSFSAASNANLFSHFSHYKGAEAFAPFIRDRLYWDSSIRMFLPIDNAQTCLVIQLTDDTFWKCQENTFSSANWIIGNPVIVERGLNPNENDFSLINLITGKFQKIWPVPLSQVEPEKEDSNRYYDLPLLDKPCLYKLNSRLDRVQVGARKILWDFEPVVYNFLPLLDWTRGVSIHIQGSGHPEYPYWIVYCTDDGNWVPSLLVKQNPLPNAVFKRG